MLEKRGARISYYDPYVPSIPRIRDYPSIQRRKSVDWTMILEKEFSAAVIVTDHDSINYAELCATVPLVLDARHACEQRGIAGRQYCQGVTSGRLRLNRTDVPMSQLVVICRHGRSNYRLAIAYLQASND
jgi:hypothetical protein